MNYRNRYSRSEIVDRRSVLLRFLILTRSVTTRRARHKFGSYILLSAMFSWLLLPADAGHQRVRAQQNQPASDALPNDGIKSVAARASLFFEANLGQLDKRVKFSTSGSGYKLFLTSTEAVYVIREPKALDAEHPKFGREMRSPETPTSNRAVAVWMKLSGANQNADAIGVGELAGKHNYFRGRDQSKWQSNVPLYQKAKIENVYQGVDLVWHYDQAGSIEYDFNVSPFASTQQIEWQIEGADKVRVEADGSLVISTPFAELKQKAPVAYQEINGIQSAVESRFEQRGENSVGFTVGNYDQSKLLTIDPVTDLAFSTFLGGESGERANAIATSSHDDSVYVTGWTTSTLFPTTIGVFNDTYSGGNDVFVTKLNDDASALIYSTYIGGGSDDIGYGIAVDTSGNAYVTGIASASQTSYPTTINAPFPIHNGGTSDAFVTKLNATGSTLLYSTFVGGNNRDIGLGIAVRSGSAYIAGYTDSVNYPTTPGAYDSSFNGILDGFVTKLDAGGSALSYSTFIGGAYLEYFSSIAVDSQGNAFLAGNTHSSSYPVTVGAFDTSNNNGDAMVTKLNAVGSQLIYSTFIGGGWLDDVSAIAIDPTGNAYITGVSWNDGTTPFPTTAGAYDTVRSNAQGNVYVTKFNAAGSALVYSTFLGGDSDDRALGIAVNAAGNAFLTGRTEDPNFPTTPGAFDTIINGTTDAFLTKLSVSGSYLVYSTYIGGSSIDFGQGIALNGGGEAFLTGFTNNGVINFPTTPGAFQPDNNGVSDVFVCKFVTPNPIVVTNTNDSGPGSLRQAVFDSNASPGDDVIEFSSLFNTPQSIFVTANIQITSNITIQGTGADRLTILNTSAPTLNSRVFHVSGGGSVNLVGMTISGGKGNLDGGGIYNSGATTLTLSNCAVSGNSVDQGRAGGGIYNAGTLNVFNSTISGNSSGSSTVNGAIWNEWILNVTNSTISGNPSRGITSGGTGSNLTVTNSTITNNVIGMNASGIQVTNGFATIGNSIVAGNNPTGPDVIVSNGAIGALISSGYNLIGNPGALTEFNWHGDQAGTPAQPLNPRLAPLAMNGGTTKTHALLANSPAVDKGYSFGSTSDQRGSVRPFDNTIVSNQTDGSDIGAFESQGGKVGFDFDGDGLADISVFRPSTGVWHLSRSQAGYVGVAFGQSGDLVTPADFDGDGKTDVAVFRPSNGTWYRLNSSTGAFYYEQFGTNGDVAVPADFDGDGQADLAVFRPSVGTFYWKASSDGSVTTRQFGQSGDKPTVGDFDGDRKADIAIYRPGNGGWFRMNSSSGSFSGIGFGISEDNPTPADYDGDGRTDISVFRPSTGVWYRLNSRDGSFVGGYFGATGDKPVAADYDGDGKADVAVFRPSNGYWYMLSSINEAFSIQQFGISEDLPAPNAFVY